MCLLRMEASDGSSFIDEDGGVALTMRSCAIMISGWEVFCEKGHNSEYLPIFLQEAGYGTYYTGKLVRLTVKLSQSLIPVVSAQLWTISLDERHAS